MELLNTLSYFFMIFIIVSTIGYICEVIYCSIVDDYFEWNRGFLFGPYLPIYGLGSIIIIGISIKYLRNPFMLFLLASCACTVVEYLASLIMEKLFNVRWWNYETQKFNINGRVCLLNSFLFGVLGLLIVYVIYPILDKIITFFPVGLTNVLAISFFIIFIVDIIVTISTLFTIRETLVGLENTRQSTDLTENTRDKIVEKLKSKPRLYKILLRFFPYIYGVDEYSFRQLKLIVEGLKKTMSAGGKIVTGTKKVVSNTKGFVVEKSKNMKRLGRK